MSRLFITLTVITSTLFTTQVPDQFDDTPKEPGLSTLEQKKKSLGLGSFMRNSRNDASSQQYFNGNRHYMTSVNDGIIGYNLEADQYGGRWPRGSSHSLVFAAGLWIGSQMYGEPRVSTIRWTDSDFTPGPIDSDPYDSQARVLKVNRWDNSSTSEDYNDWANYDFTPKAESTESEGYSLSFDGVDDYVSTDSWFTGMNNNYTLMVNFRLNQLPDENPEYLFYHRGHWQDKGISVGTDGSIVGFDRNGTGNNDTWINVIYNNLVANHWYNVAFTANDDSLKLFVDGVFIEGVVRTFDTDWSADYMWSSFGSGVGDGGYANVNIADISIWDTELSVSEIQTYMDMVSELNGNETGLFGYWNFNEGEGTTLTDLSGNGNDGTINGATWSEDVPEPPALPEILLDQSLFSIYSDDGDRRAEVRQTVYGGADEDQENPIKDAVFLHYEIENYSDTAWVDTYVSLFCDFDLGGDFHNDQVVYNPDNGTAYNTNGWNDGFERETVFGIAPLGDQYELVSVVFNPDVNGDYENYNQQQGLWADGSEIIDDSNGEPTTFMYSGNLADSTGWIDTGPSDKYVLMSVYVGQVEAGETVELDFVMFAAETDGDRVETLDLGDDYVESLRNDWDDNFSSVNLLDRPIIETEQNHGIFGMSLLELDVPQGSNISSNSTIRNGGPEQLSLSVDTNDGTENITLAYGETYDVEFSFNAPNLDAPKTIRIPEDYGDIYEALDNTTGDLGYTIDYNFNHNDPTTSSFHMSGEFYVDHAGDTLLVAPGGSYSVDYEIRDRSVHIISDTDNPWESSVFTDSSFLNLQGRIQYFSFKGFLVENSPGFIYINEYGNFWSQTNVDISHNIFRDNYNQEDGGGALDMNSVHGRVAYNIFANNSGQGLGGAIYANDVHCDFNNNVFYNNYASSRGGAMRLNQGSSHIYKNTFINNHADNGGHSIYIRSTDYTVTSNIMWGNGGDQVASNYDGYDVTYNLIQDGYWDGSNNIDADPMVNNPDGLDFSLSEESPCIDAGNPSDDYNDPDGTRSDMGAFFFNQPSFSMDFDGSSYLRVNNNPSISNFGGDLSVSAWVKVTGGEGTNRNIISKAGASPQSFALTVSDQDRFRPHVHSQSGTWYNFDGNIPVEYDIWTHVAFSYSENDGELRLYVNGQIDSTISISGSVNNNEADMYIGSYLEANGSNYHNFVGLVDELSLWNRAFGSNDIYSLMNLGLTGEEESLIGYWNFDEETYPMVYDLSQYGNHGENINGAGYNSDTPPTMNATLGEFDFLVNGSGSSVVVMSYRDPLELTFVHQSYSDTIYFEVFRDMNFNGQLDDEDINIYKHPEWSWSIYDNGVIRVVDQEDIFVGNPIIDNNPGVGITSLTISMYEGIDPWAWAWRYIQNSTNFIRAYDHHGNEKIVSVNITGSGSENYIDGRTHPGEYSNIVVEVWPDGDWMDDEYSDLPYLSATGSDGSYRVEVFDSIDFSFDYNFNVYDVFRANSHVLIDYQEHQNSGMDWFNNPINVHGGTYGIDMFFIELENSINGTVFVNGQNATGGDFGINTDDYYYYGEESSYFENYTFIHEDGSYEIWYDEPRYFIYGTCAGYWDDYDNYYDERCKEQEMFLPGGSHHVDIHLTDNEPMHQIYGTVRDTMGNPIYGAEVTAYAHEDYASREKTFSDWDGNFSMFLYGNGINYDLEAGGHGWVGNMYYIDSYQIEMGEHFEFYLEPSESDGNQIYNGDFEEGFNGWETYPQDAFFSLIMGTGQTMWNSDQSFEAFEGDSSLKMFGLYQDDIDLPEGNVFQTYYDHFGWGQQLEGSAWFMAHEDDYFGDGPSNFVLFAKYFDHDWNWKGMHISQPFGRDYSPNDWHHFNLNAIVPDDANVVQIGMMFTQPDVNHHGGVYVDEVNLHEQNDDYYTSYIEGHVYDEETGDPLEFAMVYAISDDQSFTSWGFATDSDGYFRMPVRGDRGYFISATQSPNMVYSESFDGDFSYHYINTDETANIDFYLGSGGSNEDPIVEGWLRDWYTGEPLPESTILFAYDQDGELQTIEMVTDVDGYFMVQVPPDHEYDLFVYADNYWAEHDAFYLAPGDHHVLEIGIAPLDMAARVYGSVTDAYSGDMIHGAEAVLHCGDSEDWDHTGALGTYRVFSYYPDDCEDGNLSVWADGYRTQHFPAGDLDLEAGESVTVNVTLEEGNDPEPAFMLGRVHAANTGDGIPYAHVSAYSHNSGDTYGAEADDSGWYLLELTGEEDYTVQASAEGYNDLFEDHFISSWDSLYIDFYLDEAPQSRFFGYITSTNGDSLSGARIYFQNEDDNWSNTTSDGSGYYNKDVYPGTYSIYVTNNDYYVSIFDSVSINENEEIQIDASLEPVYDFDGGVAGIIYGENGSTLSGVHINAYNNTYDAVTYSNEDGAFFLELVNGTYDIEFWKSGYNFVYVPGGITVDNNIVPYDISLVQQGEPQPPVIVHLEDVPDDQGRQLDMAWTPGDPQDFGAYPFYSVWRERNEELPPGSPQLWHFIGMVPFHDFDLYNMVVPTLGDSTDEGVFMSTFMVTGHTDDPAIFFDSSPESAYSIDNIFPAVPDSFSVMASVGEVSLNWSSPVDEDFAYHNVYRNNLMDDQPAIVFTTISSFYVDTEVDPEMNYEYWVTAVDHNGNESDASAAVEVSGSMLSTDADLVPDVYALGQNYPNPFNPSTQIRYALPEQSKVVLTVYDMLGRKVRTLVNGVQDAGYRTVMWNATSDVGTPVSAGMYIYTIRANEFYQVKKMILLK